MAKATGVDLSAIKSALSKLAQQKREMNADLEGLKRRREDLQAASLTREDVLAKLCDYIDRAGAPHEAIIKTAVETVRSTPGRLLGGQFEEGRPVRPYLLADVGKREMSEAAFLYLLQQPLKEAVRTVIEAMPWPEAGPPEAVRVVELARLDQEIADLEDKLRELQQAAIEAGATI